MVINILQKGIQVLSELDLVEDIAAYESDKEPVALFHKLNVLGDNRIRLLRAVVNKVDGKFVHVEVPQEPLVLLVLSDREIHEHHELFLLFCQNGKLGSRLGCSQLDLETGRQGIN
jgi:hypothetical protein